MLNIRLIEWVGFSMGGHRLNWEATGMGGMQEML